MNDSGFSELTNEYPLELRSLKLYSWTMMSLDNRDWSEKTRTRIPILSESKIILMNSGRSMVSLEPDSSSQYSPLTEYPLDLTHFMIENFCLLVGKGRSPHINQTFLFCGHFLLDTNMIWSLKSTLIMFLSYWYCLWLSR